MFLLCFRFFLRQVKFLQATALRNECLTLQESHTYTRNIEKIEGQHGFLLELLLAVVSKIKHVANFCFCLVQYYHFCVNLDTVY